MVELTITAKGSIEDVANVLERVAQGLRENPSNVPTQGDYRAANLTMVRESQAQPNAGEDAYYLELIWSKISSKAKRALSYMASHSNGCTKEQIAEGVKELAGTRDLGGVLSSVSRRCKALMFSLNSVYEKVDTARGTMYTMRDETAIIIKSFAGTIQNNDSEEIDQDNSGEDDDE